MMLDAISMWKPPKYFSMLILQESNHQDCNDHEENDDNDDDGNDDS